MCGQPQRSGGVEQFNPHLTPPGIKIVNDIEHSGEGAQRLLDFVRNGDEIIETFSADVEVDGCATGSTLNTAVAEPFHARDFRSFRAKDLKNLITAAIALRGGNEFDKRLCHVRLRRGDLSIVGDLHTQQRVDRL